MIQVYVKFDRGNEREAIELLSDEVKARGFRRFGRLPTEGLCGASRVAEARFSDTGWVRVTEQYDISRDKVYRRLDVLGAP